MKPFTIQQPNGNHVAATLYVCGKCGRTADELHVRDWLIASRTDTAEARAEGWMVIRCPQHITAYSRRIAGLPQAPRSATRPDYTQYVHEFTNKADKTRFAVGRWDEGHAEYIRPFDKEEYRLTGCSAEFCRTASGMQSYPTRKQALARARYLFGPDPEHV